MSGERLILDGDRVVGIETAEDAAVTELVAQCRPILTGDPEVFVDALAELLVRYVDGAEPELREQARSIARKAWCRVVVELIK